MPRRVLGRVPGKRGLLWGLLGAVPRAAAFYGKAEKRHCSQQSHQQSPFTGTLPSTLRGTFGDLGFLSRVAGGRDSYFSHFQVTFSLLTGRPPESLLRYFLATLNFGGGSGSVGPFATHNPSGRNPKACLKAIFNLNYASLNKLVDNLLRLSFFAEFISSCF